MKLKKKIGGALLLLATVIINSGATSILSIGVENMPQSMKNKR